MHIKQIIYIDFYSLRIRIREIVEDAIIKTRKFIEDGIKQFKNERT